jgi:tRNA dimethylallyltransferase
MFPDRLASSESISCSQPVQEVPAVSSSLARSLSVLSPQLLDLYNTLPDYAEPASADSEAAIQLHTLLTALDPTVAVRWHWKDTRKVLRSLRIMKDTGRKPSEIISEQSQCSVRPRFTICVSSYLFHPVLRSFVVGTARSVSGFMPILQSFIKDWMPVWMR